jgi:hypothetical protein
MNELGPEARAIVDAARGADLPTDADRDRVRASLAARLAAGAVVGTSLLSGRTAFALRLSGLAVLGGTAALGFSYLAGPQPSRPAPAPISEAGPRVRVEAAPAPAPPEPASPRAHRRGEPRLGDLELEMRLLADAQVALAGGQPTRALALLEEHARRFPAGVLLEERLAARVAALCAVGRAVDARQEADAFLLARPRSPLADRVRAPCAAR